MEKHDIKTFFAVSLICGLALFFSASAATNTSLYTIIGNCQALSCDGVTGICEETEDSYCSNLSPDLPRSFPVGTFEKNGQVCAITGGGEEKNIKPTSCSSIGCAGGDSEICDPQARVSAPQDSIVKTKKVCSATPYGNATYASYTISLPITCCDQGSQPTSHGVCTPDSNQTPVTPDFNISSPLADLSSSILQNGEGYQFHAWYDPDGSGSQLVQDVTDQAKWTFTKIGIATAGGYVSVYNLDNMLMVGETDWESIVETWPNIKYEELNNREKVNYLFLGYALQEKNNDTSFKFLWPLVKKVYAKTSEYQYTGEGVIITDMADHYCTELKQATQGKLYSATVGGITIPMIKMPEFIDKLNHNYKGEIVKPSDVAVLRTFVDNGDLVYDPVSGWDIGPNNTKGLIVSNRAAIAHEDFHRSQMLNEESLQNAINWWNNLGIDLSDGYDEVDLKNRDYLQIREFISLYMLNYTTSINNIHIWLESGAFNAPGGDDSGAFRRNASLVENDFNSAVVKVLLKTGYIPENEWKELIHASYDFENRRVKLEFYDYRDSKYLGELSLNRDEFSEFIESAALNLFYSKGEKKYESNQKGTFDWLTEIFQQPQEFIDYEDKMLDPFSIEKDLGGNITQRFYYKGGYELVNKDNGEIITIADLIPSDKYLITLESSNGKIYQGILVEQDDSTFTIQTGDESGDARVTVWKDGSGSMDCLPGGGCQMYDPDGEKTYYIDPYGYVVNPNDGWGGNNPFDASRARLGTGADEAHAQIDGWTRDVWGILHPSGGYIWPDGSWSPSPLTSYMERQCEQYKDNPVNYMYCGLGVSGNL